MTHRRTLCGLIYIVFILLAACAPLAMPQTVSVPAADLLAPSAVPSYLPTPPPAKAPAAGAAPVIHKALNLAYAHTQGVDPYLQSLDVYYTEPVSARHPVIVYVHGGGWSSGDKTHLDFKPGFFLKAGYVFISVNYRLSPAAKFPAHVQDVAAAIAWASRQIGQYGGDPKRMFVSGHSAGGHLATLVATDERYLKEQGLDLSAIKGVISIDTAGYDISVFASRCKNHVLPDPYNIAFGQNPAEWKLASPVTYIAAGKHIPPMALIFSGDVGIGSEVLREQMAKEFGEKLGEARITNEIFGAHKKNHNQINTDFGMPGDTVGAQTLEFLQKILSGL